MAHVSDLPCDGDGICMLCKQSTSEEEKLLCSTCATPWHVPCLSNPPPSLSSLPHWQCPDCSPPPDGEARSPAPGRPGPPSDLIAAVRAIEADGSLTEKEKARRRQELVSGSVAMDGCDEEEVAEKPKEKSRKSDVLELLDGSLICSFCMQLPERPVTTPCGHNFCLNCFQKWIAKGKRSCVKCRGPIPPKMASQPRINSTLVAAIRVAKTAKTVTSSADVPLKVYHFVRNQDRPDKAFTTERAQKAGKANACSGKIFVTVPPDHFGPILAENDPIRNQGVLVGELWEDRMECRQWGVHLPHVAGIAGQSEYGAQSVALSGGYQDDEDHGEWFLYTGSGGRDLSGNKRTNKEQSFDQKFEKMNQALRVSCRNGYPVRVVRSHKEKRSSYAPETGVRYDGTYRIEKCWRKVGIQGFKVCRYLFVRCDNEPAPWTSDENGDRPRPLPDIKELKNATDITLREGSPAWDYDEKHGWRWVKPPPPSRKPVGTGNPEDIKRARKVLRRAQNLSVREKLLKEFSCLLCHTVMNLPLTTPCAHNFCKPCLEGAFAGQTFVRERIHGGGRTLRAQKNVMKCPCCANDISDFLQNPQVNRELMDVIESLKRQTKEDAESSEDGIDIPEVKSGPTDGDNEVEYEMPANEDSQIAAINGRQLLTHEQKNSIMPSKEPKDGCSQNPEIRQPVSYNHKKTGDGKKGKASKKSNEVGSEKPEMIGGGSNGCQLTTKESTQPMTCSRERPKTSKKVEIGKKFNEAEPEYLTMAYVEDCQIHTTENEQPPLTSERKKARNGKKENTNKKSDKDDQDILEAIDGSDKDHNICQSKQPLTCMKEPRYLKNATESKKSNEPDVEYLQVHNGGDNDGSTAENEQPKIHVRERPITRSCSAKKMDGEKVVKSKESTDVKKPAERKISNKSGSENPEMLNGSGKGCLTTKAKQPKLFMRKRPLTRSCTKKVEGRNAKKSKKSSKVEEDGGGTSPSSPLHVLSDDDDDLE